MEAAGQGRHRRDGELVRRFNDTLANVDTVLLSRPMAAGYIDHWTRIAGQCAGDAAFAFAERIVGAHKRVLSRRAGTIDRLRTSVGLGPMRDEIAALKLAPGGTISCFGGVEFASAVLDTGLVEAQRYACGIVVQRYQPLA